MFLTKTTIIVLIFILFVSGVKAQSFEGSLALQALLSHAAEMRADRKFTLALDDYARILLIDRNQRAARQFLVEYGRLPEIATDQKVKAIGAAQLINYLDSLTEKVSQLETKIKNLDPLGYTTNMNVLPKQFSLSAGQRDSSDNEEVLEPGIALKILIGNLEIEKGALEEKFSRLQEYYSICLSAQQRITIESGGLYSQMTNLQLKQALSLSEQQLLAKEDQIEKLSRQFIDVSLQLAEKEKSIDLLAANQIQTESRLQDITARFRLGQELIEEKSRVIVELEKELRVINQQIAEYRETIDAIRATDEEKIIQATGYLEIYKGKVLDLKNELRRQEQLIAEIQKKFQRSQINSPTQYPNY